MRNVLEREGRRKIIEVLKEIVILVGLQAQDREASQMKHWNQKEFMQIILSLIL